MKSRYSQSLNPYTYPDSERSAINTKLAEVHKWQLSMTYREQNKNIEEIRALWQSLLLKSFYFKYIKSLLSFLVKRLLKIRLKLPKDHTIF